MKGERHMDNYTDALNYMLHGTKELEDVDIFLGGTISDKHDWRRDLLPYLDSSISFYDPYLRDGESGDLDWDESIIELENKAKKCAKLKVFAITSDMEGVYSIAEITEAAMKYKSSTIITVINYDNTFNGKQKKSLAACMKLWKSYGAIIVKDLDSMARFINRFYYLLTDTRPTIQ